jgi:hypothetical protein
MFEKMDARERRCTLLMLAHNYPDEFFWANREFTEMVEELHDVTDPSQRH